MTGHGSPRPHMREEADSVLAIKSDTFRVLDVLSEYRAILDDLREYAPHVSLEDDHLPGYGATWADWEYAREVWTRNLARAKSAVRDADDLLVSATQRASAHGRAPTEFGMHSLSPDMLRPNRVIAGGIVLDVQSQQGGRRGGVFL